MQSLEERIKALPAGLQQEVAQFLDELERKGEPKSPRYLRQDWAGASSHLKDKYTSVELQHQAAEWWAESE